MSNTYIILYADEFKTDVWIRYMDILGLSHFENEVKITVKDIATIEKNQITLD